MNPRKLIPLAVVLLVLVVLVFLFGRKKPRDDLRLEAGLKRLAPEDFLVSDVGRLEVFLGTKEDQKVILEKEASGWRVRSYFNAPGDGEKVSTLLEKLKNLEGEFRVSEESVLGDFDLTEEKALHFSLYREGNEQAWLRLLVGKSLPNGGFVRLKGENSIYVVDKDLRREIGLVAHDSSKAPSQSPWVNKIITELRKEDVERLSIMWPDRKAVFEKRIKTDSGPEERAETASPGKKPPPPKGFEWIAGDPLNPFPIKGKGVDGILDALAGLTAVDIIDPKEIKERGLDAPRFQCRIALKQRGEKILIASHPDPLQDGYMMVQGGDETLFRVSRHTFQGVFKKGADLFELPSFSVDKAAMKEISLSWSNKKRLLLQKTGSGELRTISGDFQGKKLSQERAKKIWDSLTRISPADFVQLHPEIDRGLGEPRYRATVTLNDGRRRVVTFGDEARGVAGRYMRIDDDPQIFVMAKADFDGIFPPIDQLFENRPTDKGK